jgi:hypothetical protein
MNLFSSKLHHGNTVTRIFSHVALVLVAVAATACYSFRGGSVPDHLKTISIASTVDRSGFGNPLYREISTDAFLRRFRSDNSLQVLEDNGDARLSPVIVRIKDQMLNVAGTDKEGQRKIIVAIEVEFFDGVKNKQVWKQTFERFGVYDAANASTERDEAAREAIRQIADDVLLQLVTDW